MAKESIVGATFSQLSQATGAVDWFINQGTNRDAIIVAAMPPGGRPRAPQRGDNQRSDLTWIVGLDLDTAGIGRTVATDTLRREGGKLMPLASEFLASFARG